MKGKFIFVSGLSGAGKSTLVGATLDAIENLETVVTYVTRPMREGEENSYEHEFVSDDQYVLLKSQSSNWDETIYAGYKYGADGAKYMQDLQDGMNVIVPTAPDMRIIQLMAGKYGVTPVTIWIDTDKSIASERIQGDGERAAREESAAIKDQFDIVFQPTGDVETDSTEFIKLVISICE